MDVKTDLELLIDLRNRMRQDLLANKIDKIYFEGKTKSLLVSGPQATFFQQQLNTRKEQIKSLEEIIPLVDEEIAMQAELKN